jgi:iron complex transport system substrate-binding protein
MAKRWLNAKYNREIIKIFIVLLILFSRVIPSSGAEDGAKIPARILSLAPAATEIIFDLGLGGRVVGVTEYCSWPPEARSKTNIGDMMHVNMETVLSMRPDLVLLSNMNEHLKGQIEALGFKTAVVYQDDFTQICASMLQIGEACGIADKANERVEELRRSVREISARAESAKQGGGTKPRVLVVVGRDIGDALFRRIYVAGPLSFYENLLSEAGAENVIVQSAPYLNISREGLERLAPDIVIELIGEHGMTNVETSEILAQWKALADLEAARKGNVAIIRGDFTFRASPRYPLILDAFARVIGAGVREINE